MDFFNIELKIEFTYIKKLLKMCYTKKKIVYIYTKNWSFNHWSFYSLIIRKHLKINFKVNIRNDYLYWGYVQLFNGRFFYLFKLINVKIFL